MEFLTAFVLGGLFCLIFQAFMMITKTELPVILIFALIIGAFLSASGLAAVLQQWGGGGIAVVVIGAGQALYDTTQIALATGNLVPLITVWCVFIALTVIGCLSGFVHRKMHQGKKAEE